MIDEFNNDCPYDFKNILYSKYYDISYDFAVIGTAVTGGIYTFCKTVNNMPVDLSLLPELRINNNIIKAYPSNSSDYSDNKYYLNNVVFYSFYNLSNT